MDLSRYGKRLEEGVARAMGRPLSPPSNPAEGDMHLEQGDSDVRCWLRRDGQWVEHHPTLEEALGYGVSLAAAQNEQFIAMADQLATSLNDERKKHWSSFTFRPILRVTYQDTPYPLFEIEATDTATSMKKETALTITLAELQTGTVDRDAYLDFIKAICRRIGDGYAVTPKVRPQNYDSNGWYEAVGTRIDPTRVIEQVAEISRYGTVGEDAVEQAKRSIRAAIRPRPDAPDPEPETPAASTEPSTEAGIPETP